MDKNLNNEIPENVRLKLDDTYKDILDNETKSKKPIKKVTKVATIAGTITALTLSSGFALEYMIEYFKVNQDSKYISTQEDVNSLNQEVNKSAINNNIEFTVDSIAADDNYINIFYTIKSDKNIKEIQDFYEDPFFAKPFIGIFANGEELYETSMIEGEASYISDTELKGIRRLNITHYDIPDKFDLDIKVDEIFEQKGKWEISTKVDKTEAAKNTKKYDLEKEIIISKTHDYENENIDVDHQVTIDRIVMSPLGNQIVIKEDVKKLSDDNYLSAGEYFALFDQDGVQLEVVDKGGSGPDIDGTQTNSFEFIVGDKEITSLVYVPLEYNEDAEHESIGAQSIYDLPMEFKISEYGKWIIDKVEVKDKQMLIHGRKEGYVEGSLLLNTTICDENGQWLDWNNEMSPISDVAIDRNNNNQIYSITFNEKYKDEVNKIKSIDMNTNDSLQLMVDQAVKIDLTK